MPIEKDLSPESFIVDKMILRATLQKLRHCSLRETLSTLSRLSKFIVAEELTLSLTMLHRARGACGYFTTSHVAYNKGKDCLSYIVNFAHSRAEDSKSIFRAPEYKPQDTIEAHQKTDIFSLGLVLYLLLAELPKTDLEQTHEQLLSKLDLCNLSYSARGLVAQCLEDDPSKRPVAGYIAGRLEREVAWLEASMWKPSKKVRMRCELEIDDPEEWAHWQHHQDLMEIAEEVDMEMPSAKEILGSRSGVLPPTEEETITYKQEVDPDIKRYLKRRLRKEGANAKMVQVTSTRVALRVEPEAPEEEEKRP